MSNSRSICHFTLPVFGATLALIAGGCAEVSFKRGGSAADFDADKLACNREIADSEQTLAACMEKRGWFLHQFDEAAAGPEKVSDETSTTETASPDAATIDAPAAENAAKPKTSKKAKAKPAAPVAIGTWFKFGAGPDALATDQAACVGELGEEHRIQSTSQPVSPAMRECMKQRGWYGLESAETR
jgi:hypothetical protein